MTTNGKPILVATDLSARSDRAVDRAFHLAKQWGVTLILLHAVETGSRFESDPSLAERAIRDVMPDPQADASIVPAIGSAPALIVQGAASGDCGLIVTGVARLNHVGDFFVGTAIDHVVRHATAPVLVVKRRPHEDYSTLLVATDFSTCSRAALITAAGLFPDAAIHLVHAFHVPYESWLDSEEARQDMASEENEELEAFLRDPIIPEAVRTRITVHLGYGECQSVVLRTVEEVNADLMVLGTHGRTGFASAVMGSMAEQLLRCAPVDTLMVRERA